MNDVISNEKAAVAAKYEAVRQLQAEGKNDEVMAAFSEALAFHLETAQRLQRMNQYDAARDAYLGLIGTGRLLDDSFIGLGVIAYQQYDYDKAEGYFKAAYAINPKLVVALTNLAAVFKQKNDYAKCLEFSEKALEQEPDNVLAIGAKGSAYFGMHRYEESLRTHQEVVRRLPNQAEGYLNVGASLKALGRLPEAIGSLAHGLSIDPHHALGNFLYALALLKAGDYKLGFEFYEARWRSTLAAGKPVFDAPLWLGVEPLAGKTILLHKEQGIGDAIQFSRYIPMVAALGAIIIVQADEVLWPLLKPLVGDGQIVAKGMPLPHFDFHCPLMSLPLAFKTTLDTVPSPGAYLAADEKKVAAWGDRLGPRSMPRIGVVWNGRAEYTVDTLRSMRLAQFPRFELNGYQVVSLQKDVREVDEVELADRGYAHFGPVLKDFSETAALIQHMDLVISVDTAVAHVAAAMGKEVWLLLSTDSDWRWLSERSDSPWYRSVRLFRQTRQGDWATVFDDVCAALQVRSAG